MKREGQWLLYFALLLSAGGGLLLLPHWLRTLGLPLLAAVAIGVGFLLVIRSRSAVAPVGEIGVWFAGIVTVYTLLPLAVYILLGGQYTALNDNRLVALQPTSEQMASIAWMYVAFLGAFSSVYAVVRGNVTTGRVRVEAVNRESLGVLIAVWLLMTLLSYLLIPRITAETYEGIYAAVAELPRGTRQLMKLWEGWSMIAPLAVRVWLFQGFERRKWLIAAWLAYDVVAAVAGVGSRTGVMFSLGSSAVLYHLLVRPIRLRTALVGGAVGLAGFLALGILRAFRRAGDPTEFTSGGAAGEFEVLFGNALDLQQRTLAGEISDLPVTFHFADLLAAFPSQVLPFQKVDPAQWYVNTFYPLSAEQGSGLAFGAIAQSVLGLGYAELIVRGVVLGCVFAWLHRYFVRNAARFWVVVAYVWLMVLAYQSFRNQSFILLSFVVQQFLPLVIVVEGLRLILRDRPTLPSAGTSPPLGSSAGTAGAS